MKTKNLSALLLLCLCSFGLISCNDEGDDGSRGFMQEATVQGDSVNGFYCYLDGGGLALSYDPWLADTERGYFSFHYNEADWETGSDERMYIRDAHVYPYSVYEVIRPLSLQEASGAGITVPDSCALPSLFSLGHGYRGYFDFSTGLSVVRREDGKKIPVRMNMVYDPARQSADTLLLQFYYNPAVPADWTAISYDYGKASCDISCFADGGQAWADSVTIVVETGEERHRTKISKVDFLKPGRE